LIIILQHIFYFYRNMCAKFDYRAQLGGSHPHRYRTTCKYTHNASFSWKNDPKPRKLHLNVFKTIPHAEMVTRDMIMSLLTVWLRHISHISTNHKLGADLFKRKSGSFAEPGGAATTTIMNEVSLGDKVSELPPRRDNPLKKLSVNLISTYKAINNNYYAAKAAAEALKPGNRCTDRYRNFVCIPGTTLFDRYIVIKELGRGSFGVVISALDTKDNVNVAIKVIKARREFANEAKREIERLKLVAGQDPSGSGRVVRLLDSFRFLEHVCLVFELLGDDLYTAMRGTKGKGMPLADVRHIGRQVLEALQLLARPEVDLVHCDVKLDNIALVRPGSLDVKLIDLGSSCFASKRVFTYIQTRYYRSPEVLLGLDYSQKIDVWSLACVLAELYTGQPLFPGSSSHDQLCRIVSLMGEIPRDLLVAGEDSTVRPTPVREYFLSETADGQTTYTLRPSPSAHLRAILDASGNGTKSPSLANALGVPAVFAEGYCSEEMREMLWFLELLQAMLVYEPRNRISPADALKHPFFCPPTNTCSTQ
jgi:dual specificity tyrosine-phosphorylation-regulated kinase 1